MSVLLKWSRKSLPVLPGGIPTINRVFGFFWASKIAIAAGGLPELGIYFNGGLGDDVMRSAVARELRKRGRQKIWQFTSCPELFAGNDDLVAVPDDFRLHRLCRLARVPCIEVNYPEIPPAHFIAMMCQAVGIRGDVDLRPYIILSSEEVSAGRVTDRAQITIQSSSLAARHPMRNKLWSHEKFQSVVDSLKEEFDIVQLGGASDPALHDVVDLRGKTSPRQAAAILAASQLFIGLATGLVHIARAVECRSVVIYGGREDPTKSGYSANENVCWTGPCAPCWLRNDCNYGRVCMTELLPEAVIAAVLRQLRRYGEPLAVDRAVIH